MFVREKCPWTQERRSGSEVFGINDFPRCLHVLLFLVGYGRSNSLRWGRQLLHGRRKKPLTRIIHEL